MSSSGRISAMFCGGDRFDISIRDHKVTVDQPVDAGGDDSGPTPTELFVGALVSCMGHFAQRFLRRNEVRLDGLRLDAMFTMSEDRPARVAAVVVRMTLPGGVPEKLIAPLQRSMQTCVVHNSLSDPPAVSLELDVPDV